MRYEELGLDRRHNRYWHFAAGGQPDSGRIFVELQVSFPCAGLERMAGHSQGWGYMRLLLLEIVHPLLIGHVHNGNHILQNIPRNSAHWNDSRASARLCGCCERPLCARACP